MRGMRQLLQRQTQLTGKAEASGFGLLAAAPLGHAGFDPDAVNTQDARGAIAGQVHAGKDTGGSQFFVCHSREGTAHLDRAHTCFGKVTKGVEVVDKIKAGDKIVSIEVQD